MVSFGRHVPPARLATFLRQHREAHAERLGAYEAEESKAPRGGEFDPFRAATLAFGIAYERAVMDWFSALPHEIREPAAGDTRTAVREEDGG